MINEQKTPAASPKTKQQPLSKLPAFPSVRFLPNQDSEEQKKKIVDRLRKSGFKLPQGVLTNQQLQEFLKSLDFRDVPRHTENDTEYDRCQDDLKKLSFIVLALPKIRESMEDVQSEDSVSFATDRSIIYSLLGKDQIRENDVRDIIEYIDQPNRLTLTIPEHEDQQNSMVSTPMSVNKQKPTEQMKPDDFETTRRKYRKLVSNINEQPIHRGKTYGRSYLDVYYADNRSQAPVYEKQPYRAMRPNPNPYIQYAEEVIEKSKEALKNSNF